jgi:hypothetical protein
MTVRPAFSGGNRQDCAKADRTALRRSTLLGGTCTSITRRMLMDRRSFVGLLAAAGAAGPSLHRTAAAQPAPKLRNVVLVHGLFADGSCWSEVIARLQAAGLNATSVQIR